MYPLCESVTRGATQGVVMDVVFCVMRLAEGGSVSGMRGTWRRAQRTDGCEVGGTLWKGLNSALMLGWFLFGGRAEGFTECMRIGFYGASDVSLSQHVLTMEDATV